MPGPGCGSPGPRPTRTGPSAGPHGPAAASRSPGTQWLQRSKAGVTCVPGVGPGWRPGCWCRVVPELRLAPRCSQRLTPQSHEDGKQHGALVVEEVGELGRGRGAGAGFPALRPPAPRSAPPGLPPLRGRAGCLPSPAARAVRRRRPGQQTLAKVQVSERRWYLRLWSPRGHRRTSWASQISLLGVQGPLQLPGLCAARRPRPAAPRPAPPPPDRPARPRPHLIWLAWNREKPLRKMARPATAAGTSM